MKAQNKGSGSSLKVLIVKKKIKMREDKSSVKKSLPKGKGTYRKLTLRLTNTNWIVRK